MKLTLILLLLITSLMAVVGAFLTTSVTSFYIDTFYQQMSSAFGADRREFVSDLRSAAEQPDGAGRIQEILEVNAGMPGRVYSIFDNPNTFAQVLLLLLPLVLALMLTSKHWQWKVICAGIFCVGGMAMAMTYSRASWVGLACAMAVFVFLWKPKLIPAFLVLCVLAVPLLPTTVLNRILTITNTSDSSTSSRVPLYQAALAVIRRSPVTGAGLGTAATQAYIQNLNLYHGKAPFVHSHDFYLEVWIQMGILGVVGFVGSMLWNIKNAARAARHTGPSVGRTVAAAAAAAMCGAMVCGIADFLWNYPRVMCIFWFTFAMAIAGVKVCTQEAN